MEQYFGSQEEIISGVYDILKNLGVPVRVHGYRYILEAIFILLENEEASYSLVREVYRPIACRHRMSHKNIESAIRTAIRVTWDNGNHDLQKAIFGYSRQNHERPCNSEFLLRIVGYIQNVYKQNIVIT